MKFVKAFATVLALGALSAPAMAEDAPPPAEHPWGTLSANIAFTSDYIFRGFSQTLNKPAVQGGLDWDSGMGIYVGTWGSNIDFGADGSMEWDVYGGYKGAIDKFSYDLGVIGYLYPGSPSSANYMEAKVALGYDFGFAALSGGFYYSPDWTGNLGHAYYINGGLTVPIPGVEGLSVSGAIGREYYDNPALVDTTDYNLGASYTLPWFTVDVRWYDTNLPKSACTVTTLTGATHTVCDSRAVVSVKRTF
jgi:uncharacterized protein (TIGR02001 family)